MITRDFIINVNNNKASSKQTIVLYKGDSGLLLNLTLKNFKFDTSIFKVDASIYNKDNTKIIYNLPFVNDKIVLTINEENLFLQEMGKYEVQLHLYDENYNRISVPPFNIEVRDTIY